MANVDDALLLAEHFGTLFNDELTSDVIFKVGSRQTAIHAHKIVLAARSPVFKAMLYGPLKENADVICIPNIEPCAFQILMRYIYSGVVADLTEDNAVQVLAAANQYELLPLMSSCIEFIQDSLSLENVCHFLVETHRSYVDIYELCMEYIETNTTKVFESDQFLELTDVMLIDIISRDFLCVQEVFLFNAVIRWAEHKIGLIYTSPVINAAVSGSDDQEIDPTIHLDKQLKKLYLPPDAEDSDSDANLREKRLCYALRDIIPHIRLPLISVGDLISIVKERNVVPMDLYILALEYVATKANGQEINTQLYDSVPSTFFQPRGQKRDSSKLFVFSFNKSAGFQISNNNLIATKVGPTKWGAVFGDKSISANAYRQNHESLMKYVLLFEIKIMSLNYDHSGMIIGLGKLSDQDNYKHCYGISGTGIEYPSQMHINNFLDQGNDELAKRKKDFRFYAGDIIGVKFDTLKRQISFFQNDNLIHVNSKSPSVNSELYPVIFMHYRSDSVSIRQYQENNLVNGHSK